MKDTIENYFKDIKERDLLYQANKIAITIQENGYFFDNYSPDVLSIQMKEKSREEHFRILLIDNSGVVITDSSDINVGKTFLSPEIMIALKGENIATYYEDEEAIYASSYIETSTSKKGAVLLISSFSETVALLANLTQKWFFLTSFISIIIGIFIFFTSDIIIIPIKKILKSINELRDGHLNKRVIIKGHNELSMLGEAFNDMAEKLEQIDTSRQEFVSNVSHELKTPLSSMKVLSDSILLQEDVNPEIYVEFLKDINSEIDRMAEIVNNLLALVKLDYKEIALNIEETSLNIMLDDIIKRLSPLASQKDIKLSSEYIKNIVIDADKVKLSLAISNLIENAIKYTDNNGTVKVIIDGEHQNIFITIADTGIGINEAEQSKIFNRFYRVDKTRDRESGGTGLGLSITHSAVLLHNGSIKLSSKEGEGSTFTIRIPIKYTEKPY